LDCASAACAGSVPAVTNARPAASQQNARILERKQPSFVGKG
jgi:hypothetical protein